ncbi:RES domain-containing protein [Undibacterium jejuense]|uniref:RES domain-containing protein n=1 Tax=Undibacterium jejuense TaxID=1344949 RepID=A0A923HGA2_9BURK|nr:RES domain-containing protein [Undibacterium jejuense]MBC3863199.1 RES domain-containing protein [Undibacterium jejuense]
MADIKDDEITIKRICHCCVSEIYLASEINSSGGNAKCSYCGQSAPSISIEELAERIEEPFSDHYKRTADQPESWQERLMADRESDYVWVRDGMPVNDAIQDAVGIDEEPAADVLEILEEKHAPYRDQDNFGEESAFSSDSYYERSLPNFIGLHMGWHEFEQSLKTRARFFSHSAEKLLTRIFGGTDMLKTRDGHPLVVDAGPRTQLNHLYRSRVFQAEDGLKEALCRPATHIGSPPARLARAGRMNAQGISVFYGATRAEVAIAEVRPPVGSQVVVARFDITRQLRLLDLTAANDVYEEGSIFDPSFNERLHRAEFLRSLERLMARPVMPDDEGIDYLPTQAVADFLATTNNPLLDGIIFPSAQVKEGYNVVLFHKSARVAEDTFPKGTEIEASTCHNTEDGWEVDYFVSEAVPQSEASKASDSNEGFLGTFLNDSSPPDPDGDCRKETLRLFLDSVEVHDVKWVSVSTERHSVRRHRYEKQPSKY